MDDELATFLDPSLEFPSVPREKILEDAETLEKILSGELALEVFYRELEGALGGESRLLAALARRDWQRNLRELRRDTETVLRAIGGDGSTVRPFPREKEVVRFARSLAGAPPERVAKALRAFAARALLCHQLVPWVSHVKQVFDHFRSRVEAEDRHLSVLQLLADLLEER